MKDNRVKETYVPLSRKFLEHLPDMPPLAVKIYIYLLLRADYNGKRKGKIRINFRELSEELNIHPQTAWTIIRKKLNGKFITYKPAKNQYSLTDFKILRYMTVRDFALNRSKSKNINQDLKQGLEQISKPLGEQGFSNSQEYKEINNIYIQIFNHWNGQKIIVHREVENFIPQIKNRLKKYSPQEIKDAITNYATILKGDDYFLTYKWSLKEFLTRDNGFEKFLTVNDPFSNYRKSKPKNINPNSVSSGNHIIT